MTCFEFLGPTMSESAPWISLLRELINPPFTSVRIKNNNNLGYLQNNL